MAQFVRELIENGVANVEIDRPELHNAFNDVVIDELTAAFKSVALQDDVRAVVLRTTGRSFCAGADVHWMKRMVDYSVDENVADATTMAMMLRAIRGCPKPVIARVHGAAIGGGVGLVAACDMAVALDGVVFCLSEVRLGIVPAVISPFVIEKIGPGAVRRYALTAERFKAPEAHRLGLINEVVHTADELDQRIAGLIRHIKDNGPQALDVCKRILSDVAGRDWDASTDITTRCIADRRVSAEGQDGLKAFLEKRSAKWVKPEGSR